MKYLEPDTAPGEMIQNIALLLKKNTERLGEKPVFMEKKDGVYQGISWRSFSEDIHNIAFNLRKHGFRKGDKMIIFSPNRLEMLELEMALMAGGGVSVPIFAFFNEDTAKALIRHSGARFIAAAGRSQVEKLENISGIEKIFVFDTDAAGKSSVFSPFSELLKKRNDESFGLNTDAGADEICLNMYTSGTMGGPKCVQLTHRNILSQQSALEKVWDVSSSDRFLSYLPWHHSFGGIFERFSALYNGACIFLESGLGKNAEEIMENWKLVKPTVFFSVPKVYQSLVELTRSDGEAEELFFRSGLKFIFTAAAPLPRNLSDEFEKNDITVREGWGLTETSPCCTLTDPLVKRQPGLVGKPIPGVRIRISDEGEIQVNGPNVMKGYYKNDEANRKSFSADGWFCTGDIGEITPAGLKLIARKDRVFKLVNGEKVIPSEMETLIQSKCHYISFAMVTGSGKDYPVAILFPNRKMLSRPAYERTPEEGCFCPRSLSELGKCLQGCMHDANCEMGEKFSRVKMAILVDDELSIEKNTLTPSMKIAPGKVFEAYKAHIENLFGGSNNVNEEVYVIRLDTENPVSRKTMEAKACTK